MASRNEVKVVLTSDEALVLFDLLHRWEDANTVDGQLEPGEQIALWALSCVLESVLVEPFQDDYDVLLQSARQRLSAESA